MARILLIEDHERLRELLTTALSAAGHSVVGAEDGDIGLDAFRAHGPFDLVITDIVMPNREGIGTILALKQVSDVPIIAMSGGGRSVGSDDALDSARLLGATTTISKPFALREMIEMIESIGKLAA
jgi:DNA-binding response OmpR family regulator